MRQCFIVKLSSSKFRGVPAGATRHRQDARPPAAAQRASRPEQKGAEPGPPRPATPGPARARPAGGEAERPPDPAGGSRRRRRNFSLRTRPDPRRTAARVGREEAAGRVPRRPPAPRAGPAPPRDAPPALLRLLLLLFGLGAKRRLPPAAGPAAPPPRTGPARRPRRPTPAPPPRGPPGRAHLPPPARHGPARPGAPPPLRSPAWAAAAVRAGADAPAAAAAAGAAAAPAAAAPAAVPRRRASPPPGPVAGGGSRPACRLLGAPRPSPRPPPPLLRPHKSPIVLVTPPGGRLRLFPFPPCPRRALPAGRGLRPARPASARPPEAGRRGERGHAGGAARGGGNGRPAARLPSPLGSAPRAPPLTHPPQGRPRARSLSACF